MIGFSHKSEDFLVFRTSQSLRAELEAQFGMVGEIIQFSISFMKNS